MTLKIEAAKAFERDLKLLIKKGYDYYKFEKVLNHLVKQEKDILINQYKDHQLSGDLKEYRELHIEGDWLIVYKVDNDILTLYLVATGNHDEVFRKSKARKK